MSLITNFAPECIVREDLKRGPLTYVTLCGAESRFVHTTLCPTVAPTAVGVKKRLFITTRTVRPGGA